MVETFVDLGVTQRARPRMARRGTQTVGWPSKRDAHGGWPHLPCRGKRACVARGVGGACHALVRHAPGWPQSGSRSGRSRPWGAWAPLPCRPRGGGQSPCGRRSGGWCNQRPRLGTKSLRPCRSGRPVPRGRLLRWPDCGMRLSPLMGPRRRRGGLRPLRGVAGPTSPLPVRHTPARLVANAPRAPPRH